MPPNAWLPTGHDEASIKARLGEPLVTRTDGAFRIGLVLNGTVSAGAWTAGVLDFLFEALDLWEAKKAEDRRDGGSPTVPDHAVSLGVAGGASGGGVCAALLARAAPWAFPHVRDAASLSNRDNPFWRVWVEELDIARMLETADLKPPGSLATSLLSGAAIDAGGEAILAWPGSNASRKSRAWLADPLRVFVTLTNLRGVPYRIQFEPGSDGVAHSTYYVDHADHMLFAFSANDRPAASLGLRGDEHFVADQQSWRQFAEFVKATAAFPGGLPPRLLSRRVADYAWRGVALTREGGASETGEIVLRQPAFDVIDPPLSVDDDYTFLCVDGGALNNQPVELVRTALSGLGKANPRGAKEADAAVLLLDPFATVPRCAPPTKARDLLGVVGGLASALMDHGRFATSDLLLSIEEDVFSRYLLIANDTRAGKRREGDPALATAGMGAFLGFLCRDFRAHDFMLGRENCRSFLMDEFVLHKDNPLFAGFADRNPGVARDFQPGGSTAEWLPVVPVLPPLRTPQAVPVWPAGALDPKKLHDRIETRAGLLLQRLLKAHGIELPFETVLVDFLLDHKLATVAEQQIRSGLAAHDLAGKV